ncbi:MAG: hypothetical protein KF825_09745 [Ferruginibacter sp.]|nr:hypothetical protein [Ferruginibacter sp.]
MKVYADTSTIGGCFDVEFKEWSLALFEEYKQGIKTLMLSDLTIQELEFAREEVRNKINELAIENKISIGVNDEVINLQKLILPRVH